MGHPTWPLYDLTVRTPQLELRLPTEDELVALCRVARAGIHAPGPTPFCVPWPNKPSPQFEREFMQHHWSLRAGWSAACWTLTLAAFRDGAPIGMQDVGADNFAVLREVRTGSWLGREFQGHGYGRQLRGAVLQLAFAELGAVVARTSAFADNAASRAVSRALGYQDNGVTRDAPEGEPRELRHFQLTREQWLRHRTAEVTVTGLDTCREMLGA